MTKELEKRIYLKAIFIALIIIVAGVIFGFYRFSVGFAAGTLVSMLNFKLLAIRTNMITSSGRPPNPFFIIASFFFRFLIMGAVLWIAINKGLTLFLGAASGLFTVTLAIYIDSFSVKVASRK